MEPNFTEPNKTYSAEGSDLSPAVPLEISADLAARVDAILQDFAEGAELETALVVERSGALVSGISSEAEVMVDVISALVAGASAAMNALVRELGSTGKIESFHQSEERAVYLAEIMDCFVLVGVSTVPVPVGVIREKARRIRPSLIELLQEVRVHLPSPGKESGQRKFSLRDAALAKAVGLTPSGVSESESASGPVSALAFEIQDFGDEEEILLSGAGESGVGSEERIFDDDGKAPGRVFEGIDEEDDFVLAAPLPLEPSRTEPTEVIEFLRDEGPGIVIEDASGAVIESPFEAEDDYDEEESVLAGGGDSIFELEDDEGEEVMAMPFEPLADGLPGEFEENREETSGAKPAAETEAVFEVDEEDSSPPSAAIFPFFEIEDAGAVKEGEKAAFELDLDDFEEDFEDEDARSSLGTEGVAEENEVPSSRPFYF